MFKIKLIPGNSIAFVWYSIITTQLKIMILNGMRKLTGEIQCREIAFLIL